MRIITNAECVSETEVGAGYLNFMGGFESKNGKIILNVDGKLYLFESHEVSGEEYQNLLLKQNKEGAKYISDYEAVNGTFAERNGL